jgi:hypothetical protein
VRNILEGYLVIGADDLLIKECNEKFEFALGYNSGELISKHIFKIIKANDNETVMAFRNIVSIIKKMGEWKGIVNYVMKDSMDLWCFGNFYLKDHPEMGSTIISTNVNITSRIVFEEDQKKRINDLEVIEKIMLDRELRMIELKKYIRELEKELKDKK